MTRLARFSYVNLYQQLFNILLYKKLKKTKLLKLVFFSSLIFFILNSYRLSFKIKRKFNKKLRSLRTFLRKANNYKLLYYKIYLKNITKTNNNINLNIKNVLLISKNLFLTEKQFEIFNNIILNNRLIISKLRHCNKISIKTISYKLLQFFFYKKKSNLANSISVLFFLYSNYGISNKFFYSYSRKYKLSIDETMLFLIKKVDIFLISFFPIFHTVPFQKFLIFLNVNGLFIKDWKKFLLKTGDLLTIDNISEFKDLSTSLLFDILIYLYSIFSLNKKKYTSLFMTLKHILFRCIPTFCNYFHYSYIRISPNNILGCIVSNSLLLINKSINIIYFLNIFFSYEQSILLKITIDNENWFVDPHKVLKVSFFLKKNIISQFVLQFHINIFHNKAFYFRKKKKYLTTCQITFDTLFVYIHTAINKLITSYLYTEYNYLNYINLLLDMLLFVNISYKKTFLLFLKLLTIKKLTNRKRRKKNIIFLKKNISVKKNFFWFPPIYSISVNSVTYNNSFNWKSFLLTLQNKDELKWIFFQNIIYNTFGSFSGILKWYYSDSINFFIYNFPYLSTKPLTINNTFQNRKLSSIFRKNTI